MSQWITKERRLAIYLRDGFVCQFCGRDMHDDDASIITLDHVVPRSKGGTHSTENLLSSCVFCNSAKGVGCYKKFVKRFDRRGVSRIHKQLRKPANHSLAKSIIEGREARG